MKHVSLSYVDIVLYRQDVWSSEIFPLKIWRRSVACHPLWELQVGNLNYRTNSGNRFLMFYPFSAIEWWSDMSYIKSIWHNFHTSHKNQNHPTIIQQSWKTYHLKHILILNLKDGCIFCCICQRYCLLPGRKPDPQSGLDVRGTQGPKNPATHRGSCAAEQLRMPVEPCVLGCSHLRMIRDR